MYKQEEARTWVNSFTAAGVAIVVAAILPGTTATALIAIEGTMCYEIGKIYRGSDYSMSNAIAAAGAIGLAAISGQIIALEALNLIPGPGWLIKGATAGTVIKCLGEAVIAYFENNNSAETTNYEEKASTDQSDSCSETPKTTLIKNFHTLTTCLESINNRKILFIGQPGAGKSSLICNLTNKKCFPLPKIGSHTDATDWSQEDIDDPTIKYNDLTLVDTPGYDTNSHPLDEYIKHFPFHCFDNAVFIIKGKLRKSDKKIYNILLDMSKELSDNYKISIVKTFRDEVDDSEIDEFTNDVKTHLKIRDTDSLHIVSNRNNFGIEDLKNELCFD